MDSEVVSFLILVGGFTIASLIFFAQAQSKRAPVIRLSKFGVNGTAIISEKSEEFAAGPQSYFVTFKFDARAQDGSRQTYRVEQLVSPEMHRYLTVGREVTIRYLPADPSAARLAGLYADDSGVNNLLVSGTLFLILAMLMAGAIFVTAVKLPSLPIPTISPTINATVYPTAVTGDLAPIQTAVAPHLSEWESGDDQTVHHFDLGEG